MKFDTPLALFQHLLSIDENNMEANLPNFINEKHEFYADVTALITAHEENKKQTSFNELIGKQAENLVEDNIIHDLSGAQVGVYRLTKKLGQGGMGAVYLGERNDGQLEQKVAIKFVYPSIVAVAGEDFLQKEAQHLANLDHVNITKIFTVDKTEQGLPYMVMEYVDGIPIDQYCEENKLALKDRLKLFQKVCNAVQTAHQNMVIHADIKPSNILVDKQGEPKLMDFGIAKTISHAVNDNTENPRVNANYIKAVSRDFASPEQFSGRNLTTSCDIYSLGKLLGVISKGKDYELNEVIKLASKVESSERYASVLSLNADISYFLQGMPITAVEQTYSYFLKKFVNRNPMMISFIFLFLISMIAFNAVVINKNRQLREEKALSESILGFMMSTFEAGNPELSYGKTITAKDLLVYANKDLEDKFQQQPVTKSKIQRTIAQAFSALGEYEHALPLLKASVLVNETEVGHGEVLMELGDNYYDLGNYIEASNQYKSALQLFIEQKQPELTALAKLMNARTISKQGDYKLALAEQNEALVMFIELQGKSSENVAVALLDIAQTLVEQGQYEASLSKRIEALEIRKKIFPGSHYKIGDTLFDIGTMLLNIGRFSEALSYQQQGIEIVKTVYGENHPKVASYYNDIANSYASLEDYEKAIEIHKKSIGIFEGFFGKNHIDVAYAYTYLANVQIDVQAYEAAIINYRTALKIIGKVANEHHHAALAAINGLAICFTKLEDLPKAKQYFEKAITGLAINNGDSHPRVAISKFNLARVVIKMDEKEYAKNLANDAITVFIEVYGEDHLYTEKVKEFLQEI